MTICEPAGSGRGLEAHGLARLRNSYWNLGTAALYEHALRNGEGTLAADGPLVVLTGRHTGRSAGDKFIVCDRATEGEVDWGQVNVAMAPRHAASLHRRMLAWWQGRDAYVQDLYSGACPARRVKVRVITQQAWHSLFARHLLICPPPGERAGFQPDFTVLQAPGCAADPNRDGTRSETAIVLDFSRRLVLIAGTAYAGEIKKAVFTILNFLLPPQGVLPMHCAVNVGKEGDAAVFFGLSGTGKTTLSADPARRLVGDDEHGWGEGGLFNFEGGCYAKAIRLCAQAEPDIFATTRRFGTLLENVVMDAGTRALDLDDGRLTENTRAAYPLEFIARASPGGQAGHPGHVAMLAADAFGVLPPISRLDTAQAVYHFLSGYTAKVAGTERGAGQGTAGDLFGLFRRPLHAAPPHRLCRHAGPADRPPRRHLLAGQHPAGPAAAMAPARACRSATPAVCWPRRWKAGWTGPAFAATTSSAWRCPNPAPACRPGRWTRAPPGRTRAPMTPPRGQLAGRFHRNFAPFAGRVDAAVRRAGPRLEG